MHAQRGFTLVEVLVATAISTMLALTCIAIAHAWSGWSTRTAQRASGYAALDALEDRLDAEGVGAWSVFVPSRDIFGGDNSDGHELDLATRDALHRDAFRAFVYDATAKTLALYTYGAPGGAALSSGTIASGMTAFAASTVHVDALGDALFADASVSDADVDLGFGIAEATGGNRLTIVRLTVDGMQRTIPIASGTAPSRLTVVLRYTPAP